MVALLAGSAQLPSALTTAIKVQQTDEAAIAAGITGGLILDRVVGGSTVKEAVAWALSADSNVPQSARDQLAAALEAHKGSADFSATAKTLGLSCGLPASLQVAVLAALNAASFVGGVRANIIAGGDNASRNVLTGALLAAQFGLESIPSEWTAKTKHFSEAEALVSLLVSKS